MMRNIVGNVEVSSSGKGIIVTLDVDMVNKLHGYVSKETISKANVMIDINEMIDVLNQESLHTACYGFMEVLEAVDKIVDENGVDVEALGKTDDSATEATVMETPVGQFEDVHAETFEDVEAKTSKKRGKK